MDGGELNDDEKPTTSLLKRCMQYVMELKSSSDHLII